MVRARKYFFIATMWLFILAGTLEIAFRLTAPWLPKGLQAPVHYVQTGQRQQKNRIPAYSAPSTEYGITINPNLKNEQIMLGPVLRAQVTTTWLWGNPSVGFRTPPIDYKVDAVFVGDSYTFCYTEYEDCWVTIFARNTGLGVVNLGQPGTGSMSHWRVFNDYGKPLAPRLVIWQYFGNDFNEDYGLALSRGEVEKLPEGHSPQRGEDTILPPLAWLRRHSMAFAVLESVFYSDWAYLSEYERAFKTSYQVSYRDGKLEFGALYDELVTDKTAPPNIIGISLTREALATTKAAVESQGGTFVVVIIPFPVEVYAHLTASIISKERLQIISSAHQTMLEICQELSLLCLDVLPAFQDHARQGEHLFYTNDEHLNPYGNALLARLVWEWLGERGLLYVEQ